MINSKSAVSPVIGVILLVVITVVIAAAVWFWLVGLIGGGAKTTPTVEMSASKEDGNYTINITRVSRSDTGLNKVRVYILKAHVTKDSYLLDDDRIYGNRTGNLAFVDEDMDETLSVGDCIKLRGEYAESGITVRLMHISTNEIMGEITV
ncbi:MAG: type IV pilin [Candidatus Thermoplasmatota archaeon]